MASYLPQGRVWEQAFNPDSNFGKLIAALAIEYYRLSLLTQKLSDEMDIAKTDELLIEWEKSVGIPNFYFSTEVTIERRREQVEQLFSNFGGVQTGDDLVRVALFFGFEIEVFAGSDFVCDPITFPLPFPIPFSPDTKTRTHTIYINILGTGVTGVVFPLPFPIPFSINGETFLRLIFEILIPANVQLIFI